MDGPGTHVPPSAVLREYAAKRRAFTRKAVAADLGGAAMKSIQSLLAAGEIVSPARGVYCLPGIHDEDPRLKAALDEQGSTLYPPERRIAAMLPAERRAARESRRLAERTKPRAALLAYIDDKGIVTVSEVRDALGSAAASRLAELAEQGAIQRIHTGVYAAAHVDPNGTEADNVLSARAAADAAVVSMIDAARTDHANSDGPVTDTRREPPQFANAAILKYWDSTHAAGRPLPEGRRPPIARVYVEIPGYPAFYGQRSARKMDGRSGTIAWGSASPKLGPVGARALARKVFDPVPDFFSELEALVPGRDQAVVPLTIRNDAHADVDPVDDPAPVTPDGYHLLPCAYTRSDTRALDPGRLQHPLPEPVRILVDHREPASIITALRRVQNLEVIRTELPVGDYLVDGRIVIERKSNDDFHSSLADKGAHLIRQAERMAETGLHRILLIEGGPYARRQFVLNRLVSTLSYLQNVHGIHVTPTMNRQHSVYAIVQAVKHHLFGMLSEPRAPDPQDKRDVAEDPSGLVRLLLSHLQGVSEDRVRALCDHFGTLRAIAEADVDMLREVKGIGPKVASHIHSVFNHHLS